MKKFVYLVPNDFDNCSNPKTEFFIINEIRAKQIEIIACKSFNAKLFETEKNIDGIIFSSLKMIWKEQKMIQYARHNSINLFWWYFDTASTSIGRKYKVRKIAKQVSLFFNKDLIRFKLYEKLGIKPIWLDQGVPRLCSINKDPNYKHDVSFFGSFEKSHSKRFKILKMINKKFDLIIYTKDTERFKANGFNNVKDFISHKSISKNLAKINLVLHGDYNTDYCWSNRVHVMIGSSGFTLVEKIEGLDKFYKDNEHCVYFNLDNLKNCLELWLCSSQDKIRERIRLSGFDYAHKHHSYEERTQSFINQIKNFD